MNVNSGGSSNHTIGNHHTLNSSNLLSSNTNNQHHANSHGQQQQQTTRISRSSTRKKPFHFISNMWKMKKIIKFEDIMFHREMNCRARSEPSGAYLCACKSVCVNVWVSVCLLLYTTRTFRSRMVQTQFLRSYPSSMFWIK